MTKDEIARSEDAVLLDLFTQGIKFKATLEKYTGTPRMVLCDFLENVLDGTSEEMAS